MSLTNTLSRNPKKNEEFVYTKNHQKMVLEHINKNPGESLYEPSFCEFVDVFVTPDITKKVKMVITLLVLTKFRIYLFPKGKQCDRDLPLLYLSEINGRAKNVTLKFNIVGKESFVALNGEYIPRIVYLIRENFRRISFGVPKIYSYAYDGAEELTDKYNPGPAHGYIGSYEAWCNLSQTPIHEDVIEYVKDLDAVGKTDFILSACPGIDLRSEITFESNPVAYAIKNNTYWRSLEIRDIEHKEVMTAVALALTENRVITRVVCSNCSSDIPEFLGQALMQNPYHRVSILDLSGNKFMPKAVESLALAFQNCPHTMEVINLNDTGITSIGFNALITAWSINWGLTLAIEELNISNNQVGQASTEFIQFMSNMRRHSKLKRLSLANTGIAVGSLVLELGFLKLTYLDFSDNKFDKLTLTGLVFFCETTKTLETFRLANTDLGAVMIGKILKSLFENESIKTLSVDISRNNLGLTSISALAPGLKIATFDAFDVSDNGLKAKGTMELLSNIKSVQRLILDRNWGREEREYEDLAKALGAFIGTHPSLYHLSLVGTSGNRFGRMLKTFFSLLSEGNSYLEELDFSGNAVGDAVFSVFSSALSACSLKSIRCDGNDLTYSAYMTLNRSLPKSTNLEHMDFPMIDYEASETRLKPKYLEVLVEIAETLYKRIEPGHTLWRPSPFTFDLKWPTPTTFNPLHLVPPELQAISAKIYSGSLPTLPREEEITSPPSTPIYINSDDSARPSKKSNRPTSPKKKNASTLKRNNNSSSDDEPPPPNYLPGPPPPDNVPPVIPPPPVEIPPPPPPSEMPPPPTPTSPITPTTPTTPNSHNHFLTHHNSFGSRPTATNQNTKKNLLGTKRTMMNPRPVTPIKEEPQIIREPSLNKINSSEDTDSVSSHSPLNE